MQESNVSPQPVVHWPLSVRLGLSGLFFLDTVLHMYKHFLRFEWVPLLCTGLGWLLYLPRQKGETFVAYLKQPRGFAFLALFIAAMVWFGIIATH
jgi:hypothetical protein